MRLHDEFLSLMQSQGTVEPDEDVLEDAVAFAGVSKYPARIKCALLSWMAWKDATMRALEERGETGAARDPDAGSRAALMTTDGVRPDDAGDVR